MQESVQEQANERVLEVLLDQGEITWQNIINELINSGEIDPWDVDVSKLCARFIELIQNLKEMNFQITGKLVLASALLLKIKSNNLLNEGLTAFDNLLHPQESEFDLHEELFEDEFSRRRKNANKMLVPRTPQPRKRKVSIQDLMKALEKALVVESKRPPPTLKMEVRPSSKNEWDLGELIKEVFGKINNHYNVSKNRLRFQDIIPSENKEDKVLTFIPLLHLENQRKIYMEQKEAFGEIGIHKR